MSGPKLDLAIRGGIVVTSEGRSRLDVGVAGGRVVELGAIAAGQAVREMDVAGRFVLPGGVDPHVHLHVEKFDPEEPDWVDDYTSGSEAALAGGVTTVGNMSYVLPWETIADRVRAETVAVAREAIADIFFHTVILTPGRELCAELGPAVAGGQSSMKIFMCLPSFESFVPEF